MLCSFAIDNDICIFKNFASYHDTSNFDGQFTGEPFQFTPPDKELIMAIDQSEFESFPYVNKAYLPTPTLVSITL
ncbi:unnamed protein product [Adineta steineri]|uniref:Protein kinase C-terminal domain-containing protein n=1 Tax=Adineta steineri TaxID=433720 RepID=A0A814GVQ8_9BILA|nr:unnamed protein product [Adineta steineri]